MMTVRVSPSPERLRFEYAGGRHAHLPEGDFPLPEGVRVPPPEADLAPCFALRNDGANRLEAFALIGEHLLRIQRKEGFSWEIEAVVEAVPVYAAATLSGDLVYAHGSASGSLDLVRRGLAGESKRSTVVTAKGEPAPVSRSSGVGAPPAAASGLRSFFGSGGYFGMPDFGLAAFAPGDPPGACLIFGRDGAELVEAPADGEVCGVLFLQCQVSPGGEERYGSGLVVIDADRRSV
jgi:hypothetical protein